MIPILFQSNKVVVVDKPCGFLSVPGRFRDDPRPVLGLQLQTQLAQQIFPVHRLDLEVSGLMLFALTPQALRILSSEFEKKTLQKTYQAVTQSEYRGGDRILDENLPAPGEWVRWQCRILRGKKRSYESPAGQEALTDAQVLRTEVCQGTNLVEWRLRPLTGRSHQLRYELYRHGFPILGDTLYGGCEWRSQQIALRAVDLSMAAELANDLEIPAHLTVPPLQLGTILS